MNYYIQCPECGQIVEVNYKPKGHRCRCCGRTFKVTSENSCPKPRVGLFYSLSLLAMFIGANGACKVFRGYAPESYIAVALLWIFAAFGISLLASWYERATERSIEKYGCKRSKRSVSRTKSGSVEGPYNSKRV